MSLNLVVAVPSGAHWHAEMSCVTSDGEIAYSVPQICRMGGAKRNPSKRGNTQIPARFVKCAK